MRMDDDDSNELIGVHRFHAKTPLNLFNDEISLNGGGVVHTDFDAPSRHPSGTNNSWVPEHK
jgi:hypothetical protein